MTRSRGVSWTLGAPARAILLASIAVYRRTLSGLTGGQCRFFPSCSRYAEEAIRVHGAVRGSALAAWRIMRCGPFTRGGVDHVPARGQRPPRYRHVYESDTRSLSYDAVPLEGAGRASSPDRAAGKDRVVS